VLALQVNEPSRYTSHATVALDRLTSPAVAMAPSTLVPVSTVTSPPASTVPPTVRGRGPVRRPAGVFLPVDCLVETMTDADREQPSAARPGLPDGTSPGRVALRVTDLDRQVSFYRDVLGLDVRDRDDETVTLGTDTEPLLELHHDPDAPDRAPAETGLYHVAFLFPSRGALGDALRRVRERWRLTGASDHGVSEALYLTDPEDNGVELYRDRPRSEWPVSDDDRVEMGVESLDVDAITDLACGNAGLPDETTVGHVHLEVSDLAAAESFYAETLGLNVRQRYADAALFLAAGGYHHHVGLNTWHNRRDPPAGRGLHWFELLLPDESTLDAVETRLRDADVPVRRPEECDGFEVDDPDGITLRLCRR
jgi:catechol 2,3-dioxygenase